MATKTPPTTNPLLSTTPSETPLNIQLHPLVLLTITDYITRHTLRQQPGPIIGAIIGQQTGRNYTLEHAFECKPSASSDTTTSPLDAEWFSDRLAKYSEVHKEPALDLVAIFAMGPAAGPQPEHLPLLAQVRQITSLESTLLLLFHPDLVDSAQGGKLPISIYELVDEGTSPDPRFREVTFEVETGDAEMIGVDFVAKGSGVATSAPKSEAVAAASSSSAKDKKGKGKQPLSRESDFPPTAQATDPTAYLSAEDDELLSLLTAKVNAIRMLNARINLVRTYLAELPHSYLTDGTSATLPESTTNFPLLRRFNAMLAQAALLAPPTPSSSTTTTPTNATDPSLLLPTSILSASAKERQDVHLTTLLANLTRSVAEAQSLGTKLSVVQRERASKARAQHGRFGGLGGGPGRLGGLGDGIGAGEGGY